MKFSSTPDPVFKNFLECDSTSEVIKTARYHSSLVLLRSIPNSAHVGDYLGLGS